MGTAPRWSFRVETASVVAVSGYILFIIVCLSLGTGEFSQYVSVKAERHRLFGMGLVITWASHTIVEEIAYIRYLLTPMQRSLVRNWDWVVFMLIVMFALGVLPFSLFLAGVTYGMLGTCFAGRTLL